MKLNFNISAAVLGRSLISAGLLLLFLSAALPIAHASKPPLFELKTLDNKTYRLKDDLGKSPILLFFWTNCCGLSHKAYPRIEALYNKFKPKGLKAYAINVDEASAGSKIKPSVQRYGYKLPILIDPTSEVFRKFSPMRIKPYVVIVDSEGEIKREFSGYKPGDESEMEKLLEQMLSLDKSSRVNGLPGEQNLRPGEGD